MLYLTILCSIDLNCSQLREPLREVQIRIGIVGPAPPTSPPPAITASMAVIENTAEGKCVAGENIPLRSLITTPPAIPSIPLLGTCRGSQFTLNKNTKG